MKNLTIRGRIILSFAVVILAMVAMGAITYVKLVGIDDHANQLQSESLPQLGFSSQLLAKWNENFSITEEFVGIGQAGEFDSLVTELQDNRAAMDELIGRYLSVANANERIRVDAVKAPIGTYTALQDQFVRMVRDALALPVPTGAAAGNAPATAGANAAPPTANGAPLGGNGNAGRFAALNQAATFLHDQIDPLSDKGRQAMAELADYSQRDALESSANIIAAVAATREGLAINIAVALGLAFLCGFLLLRSVTRPLSWLVGVMDRIREGDLTQRVNRSDEFRALGEGFNRMADELSMLFGQIRRSGIQVGMSVTQIAATSKEQQATASEIAATTTEIGATSKEISATSKDLVRTMTEVSRVAEHTATLASDGQGGLQHMEETMRHVMEAAGSINAKLTVLNEKASNINQVVTTITKVADQTNLLSLNAAIEAEKAGEYGRGFAVVAGEIRRLADQTAVATYDIEQMVKEIQSAVSAGVMGMDKFSEEVRRGMEDVQQVGGQLSRIIQQVQALVPRFETANEGMQAQATGAEQITEALVQLTEAAQQTVETLRQSGMAIDELNQVSATLQASVSRVKLAAA